MKTIKRKTVMINSLINQWCQVSERVVLQPASRSLNPYQLLERFQLSGFAHSDQSVPFFDHTR